MRTCSFCCLLISLLWPRLSAAQVPTRRLHAELLRAVQAPGVVQIQDSLFMDATEIANIHWLEYLHFVRRDSSAAFYQAQLPDSTIWRVRRRSAAGDTLSKAWDSYYRDPAFRYFPAAGISYQQALNFCRWRTAVVQKQLQSADYRRRHRELEGYDVTVTYRLPSPAEWELAAAGGLNLAEHPWGMLHPPRPGSAEYKRQRLTSLRKDGPCLRAVGITSLKQEQVFRLDFNVREDYYLASKFQAVSCPGAAAKVPRSVYGGAANGYGLYNLIGNVAEMTTTEGLAKGGSFADSIQDFTLKSTFGYLRPGPALGFRCVAIVQLRRKAATAP